ncbi:MAG TPA: RES family NAD+ phosphorylase [Candidatus Baltobacteraceae bacterium]|jgi:RES domain-containing protein|nr:RES family NAD+ phosphorylase [Candidatus Baltobacteraceae bacterium]
MALRGLPHVSRGGTYYRICGPDWEDPSDTQYSKDFGGRWNANGSYGALYLNQNLDGARANAQRFIANQFGPDILPEDIDPAFLPDAAVFTVESTPFVDAVTADGRKALGLAVRYAQNAGHAQCQAIGAQAYAAKEDGIATLSAVTAQSEELVVFDRAVKAIVRSGKRTRFAGWYPSAAAAPTQPAPSPRRKRKATQKKR